MEYYIILDMFSLSLPSTLASFSTCLLSNSAAAQSSSEAEKADLFPRDDGYKNGIVSFQCLCSGIKSTLFPSLYRSLKSEHRCCKYLSLNGSDSRGNICSYIYCAPPQHPWIFCQVVRKSWDHWHIYRLIPSFLVVVMKNSGLLRKW